MMRTGCFQFGKISYCKNIALYYIHSVILHTGFCLMGGNSNLEYRTSSSQFVKEISPSILVSILQ